MPEPNRTVMCGAALGPVVHKLLRTNIKFVAAVGVANLKNWTRDGLALSSRNEYLTEEQRQQALAISSTLTQAREAIAEGERDPRKIWETISKDLLLHKDIRIEYVEIVDARTLTPVREIIPPVLIAVAASVGNTRLIDNTVIE